MEEEKLRKIAELREFLEERIRNLEAEIDGLKMILEFVNNLLLEKSFKRVEEIAPPKPVEAAPAAPPVREAARVIPLKTSAGEPLANIYVEDKNLRIIPEADKKFDVNTPPFGAFLVDKVLAKMRDTDLEAVRRGEIMPDEALSFDLRVDGNIIREIFIRNVTPQRERELRSAIRWTLEKMYDKTRGVQP
ncbi:MAG: hypothetical protein QXK89_03140 [Candidatus Bathyarchaeia archaeon]|nr:hypothetical protein [Candidatus Bathyarchaeota archaeon]